MYVYIYICIYIYIYIHRYVHVGYVLHLCNHGYTMYTQCGLHQQAGWKIKIRIGRAYNAIGGALGITRCILIAGDMVWWAFFWGVIWSMQSSPTGKQDESWANNHLIIKFKFKHLQTISILQYTQKWIMRIWKTFLQKGGMKKTYVFFSCEETLRKKLMNI